MNTDQLTTRLADAAFEKISPIITSYMDKIAAAEARIRELELMVAEQRGVIKAMEDMNARDLRAREEYHKRTHRPEYNPEHYKTEKP